MSNEFEVHNFYNHDIEELHEIKDDFMNFYEAALEYKEAHRDLTKLSKSDWQKKWDDDYGGSSVGDYQIYDQAEDHWKEQENK